MCVYTYTNYINSENLSTLRPYAMRLWIHIFLCISVPVFNSIISRAIKASHLDSQQLVNYCQQANYSSQSAPVNKTQTFDTTRICMLQCQNLVTETDWDLWSLNTRSWAFTENVCQPLRYHLLRSTCLMWVCSFILFKYFAIINQVVMIAMVCELQFRV